MFKEEWEKKEKRELERKRREKEIRSLIFFLRSFLSVYSLSFLHPYEYTVTFSATRTCTTEARVVFFLCHSGKRFRSPYVIRKRTDETVCNEFFVRQDLWKTFEQKNFFVFLSEWRFSWRNMKSTQFTNSKTWRNNSNNNSKDIFRKENIRKLEIKKI